MKEFLRKAADYMWARLKEPSTYAGLAGIATGIGMLMAGNYTAGFPALGGGVIAIIAPEKAAAK